ncbi:MAG: glutamine-hydrolyzing GMP synthase [Hymenobacteraceae bacterium]|nr:glutamine-hydrolyzing GMP synthase [Hymenobacteraceae bacterium]
MADQLLILDFGSQYTQLIARRVRELNVYCEIHPFDKIPALGPHIKGVILSGSPCSVRQANAPLPDLRALLGHVPVLGVCSGAQLLAHQQGGEVAPALTREYGRARLETLDATDPLLIGIQPGSVVWMSHGDTITRAPAGFQLIAGTESVPVAAYRVTGQPTWGIQFHPEVTHTEDGKTLLANFVYGICGCAPDWTPAHFVDQTVADLQARLGDDTVLLGLSGGVDSSVAALLLHRAIGPKLRCIFVDNGLLRHEEYAGVLHSYQDLGLNVVGVDARAEFYAALVGLIDPEAKRKAIGRTFIEAFDREAHKVGAEAKWLAQGTIYPDVIESVSINGPSVMIKSHHNVGGLPERMHLRIVEPLRALFKDEVRQVGAELALPPLILNRHPFPGPGLGIRILGEVTPEKVAILQKADHIFIEHLRRYDLYEQVWQAGAILLPVQTVGVMGDERTYERVVALRAVTSVDGMTADWAHLPYSFLADVSNAIINQVKGVNRVVYDISSKPPATIEWE